MILIIGGFAQGKLHYVEQHYVQREDRQEVPVLDGTLRLASDSKITWAIESAVETMPGKQTEQPTGRQTAGPQVIVNHLHRYIREQLRQGTDPERHRPHGSGGENLQRMHRQNSGRVGGAGR